MMRHACLDDREDIPENRQDLDLSPSNQKVQGIQNVELLEVCSWSWNMSCHPKTIKDLLSSRISYKETGFVQLLECELTE